MGKVVPVEFELNSTLTVDMSETCMSQLTDNGLSVHEFNVEICCSVFIRRALLVNLPVHCSSDQWPI